VLSASGGGIWQAPGRASPGWRLVPVGRTSASASGGRCRRTTARMARARDYLPDDHARPGPGRWGQDGLAGSGDTEQRLCPGLALRNNGRDPILQQRVRADRRPGPSWRARQGPLVEGRVGHARSRHTRGGSLTPHPQNAPERRLGALGRDSICTVGARILFGSAGAALSSPMRSLRRVAQEAAMVGGVGSVSACLECRSPGISACGKTGEDQPAHVAPRGPQPLSGLGPQPGRRGPYQAGSR
jgi:hypothetical protein